MLQRTHSSFSISFPFVQFKFPPIFVSRNSFGESHGTGIGAVVDGVPPGLPLNENDIQTQVDRRRPGQSVITTTRDEKDQVKILSGTENGVTLGTPIGLFIPNENVRPQDYYAVTSVPRPGQHIFPFPVREVVPSFSHEAIRFTGANLLR